MLSNNRYSIGQPSQYIDPSIGSDIFRLNMNTVYSILDQQGMPFWMQFATSVQNTSITTGTIGAPDDGKGGAYAPQISTARWQTNSFYSKGASSGVTDPCMFLYKDSHGLHWENRICGSTDNNLSRSMNRTRGFAGNILQARILMNEFCCGTAFEAATFPSVLSTQFNNLMTEFFTLSQDRIIDAIFAPVVEVIDGGTTNTKTFEDDTEGHVIDLSAAGITLQSIIRELSVIADVNNSTMETFWFIPNSLYTLLAELAIDTNYKGVITSASMMDKNTGGWCEMGFGLQFALLPNVKIIPMDETRFPVDASGNIITPMLPRGSVAYSIDKPSRLTGLASSASTYDIMSMSESVFAQETNTLFQGANISRIEGYAVGLNSGINWNSELAFFTSFVAGRLTHPKRPMYRILVAANPTVGTNPAPPIPVTNPASPAPSKGSSKKS